MDRFLLLVVAQAAKWRKQALLNLAAALRAHTGPTETNLDAVAARLVGHAGHWHAASVVALTLYSCPQTEWDLELAWDEYRADLVTLVSWELAS